MMAAFTSTLLFPASTFSNGTLVPSPPSQLPPVFVNGERVVQLSELEALNARVLALEQAAALTTQHRTQGTSDAPWVLSGVNQWTLTRYYHNLAPSGGVIEIAVNMPWSSRDSTFSGTVTFVGTNSGAPGWSAQFACFGHIFAGSTTDGNAPSYLPINPGCTTSHLSFRRNNDFTHNLFIRITTSSSFSHSHIHFNLHQLRM